MEYLYHSHLNKRKAIQPDVLTTVETFTKSGVLENLRSKLSEILEEEKNPECKVDEIKRVAEENVCVRLSELLALEPYIDIEDAVEKHHQIRIAAKRLRYTMEIFQDIYDDKIKTTIDAVKGFQDQLGEIHDIDVWMNYIPVFIAEECNSLPKNRKATVINSLNQFLAQLQGRRHQLYTEFVSNWKAKKARGLFKDIRELVSLRIEETKEPSHRKILSSIKLTAGKYDPDPQHSKQVTLLALMLFDGLTGLHGFGEPERELLEYASMLHDIGWYRGGDNHNINSMEMILTEEELPFSKRTRCIIANVARYHNKGTPGLNDKEYASLDPEDSRRVDALSAILRVADGLDASHDNVVEQIKVADDGEVIRLECKVSKDKNMEEDALRKKRKLFKNIFHKQLLVEWMAA